MYDLLYMRRDYKLRVMIELTLQVTSFCTLYIDLTMGWTFGLSIGRQFDFLQGKKTRSYDFNFISQNGLLCAHSDRVHPRDGLHAMVCSVLVNNGIIFICSFDPLAIINNPMTRNKCHELRTMGHLTPVLLRVVYVVCLLKGHTGITE